MIINGDIPSTKLYEDDLCIAILDINPVNKGHALVISKECYPTFTDAPIETLSHMMEIARRIDQKQREALKADGTNIMINNSPASGQEVPHLHIHVIPRKEGDGKTSRQAWWILSRRRWRSLRFERNFRNRSY